MRQRLFHAAMDLGKRYQQLLADGKSIPPWMELAYGLAKKVAFKRIYERTGGNIRYFMSGGAPLRRDIGEFFLACGLKVVEGYGLTETSPVITTNIQNRLRFGTVGKPIDGVDCRIADDGEIICRGPNVMQGYYNKPAETREAIDEEGWFHTGDIGHFDEEGYLVITDRKKELLVLSNGKKVPPQPHENHLKASLYIEQAMLLGDNRQYVAALIVPAAAAIQQWATASGVTLPPQSAWNTHDGVRKLIQADVDKLNATLARYEQVKNFAILEREFTQDHDEMTPTLKLKRKLIKEHFMDTITRIYETPDPNPA
jgi:long-chain acyl-CoA synthetase